MATIVKLSSGNYRVQVRRKGQYASKTFLRKADAYTWATEAERRTDLGRAIKAPKITGFNTFGQLIDLHIVDMVEVGKPLGRSKEFALRMLNKHLGKIKIPHLKRCLCRHWWEDQMVFDCRVCPKAEPKARPPLPVEQ